MASTAGAPQYRFLQIAVPPTAAGSGQNMVVMIALPSFVSSTATYRPRTVVLASETDSPRGLVAVLPVACPGMGQLWEISLRVGSQLGMNITPTLNVTAWLGANGHGSWVGVRPV
jgi:hypothetical protein